MPYLAPDLLKHLIYRRENPAVTLLDPSGIATLPWIEQETAAFQRARASD